MSDFSSSEIPNSSDCISRQATLDTIMGQPPEPHYPSWYAAQIEKLPAAQPTLCGYNIEHLILIANVLRKENLPPERVVEALTDIGRIVSIVKDEFEESLRRAVEQCKV